jgi:hypothetical protein
MGVTSSYALRGVQPINLSRDLTSILAARDLDARNLQEIFRIADLHEGCIDAFLLATSLSVGDPMTAQLVEPKRPGAARVLEAVRRAP